MIITRVMQLKVVNVFKVSNFYEQNINVVSIKVISLLN